MKLRKKGIIAMMALIGFGFSAVVTSTLAWFKGEITLQGLTGGMKGAYFAGGDGSADNPYQITHPIHLYNLAWLQYLGTFNNDKATNPETGSVLTDESGHQMTYRYHFVIKNDLDMSGWALPPIGTEQYPFIGHLNGGNYVVSNLITSNDVLSEEVNVQVAESVFSSALAKRPQVVTSWNSSDNHPQPNIVGMFGVIGNLEDKDGNVSGTTYYYDSEANCVENLGIAGLTVKTRTSSALIGMAAGYVNGKVSNVAVDSSSINVASSTSALTSFTNNLSDYSIIGYCTDDYKKDITRVEQNIYGVNVQTPESFNALDSGDGNGWGGSINMKTLFERINIVRTYGATSNPTDYHFHQELDSVDGVEATKTNIASQTAFYRYLSSDNAGHPYTGNYMLYKRGQYEDTYQYLCGGHVEDVTSYTSYQHNGKTIASGNHYLHCEGSLSDNTSSDTATLWTIPDATGTISCQWEGQTYYLRNDSGSLAVTTTQGNATTWTVTTDGGGTLITNNGYRLFYTASLGWTLLSSGTIQYNVFQYTRNSQTCYLGPLNNNVISETTSLSNALHWYRDNNGRYYYVDGGTNYYLGRYFTYTTGGWITTRYYEEFNYPFTARSNPSETGFTIYALDNDSRLKTNGNYVNNRNLYTSELYAQCSDGTWTATPTQNQGTVVNFVTQTQVIVPTADFESFRLTIGEQGSSLGPDLRNDGTVSYGRYPANETTYIPLNVKKDGAEDITSAQTFRNNVGNYDPEDSNTGYLISGSNFAAESSSVNASRNISNIRVSQYSKSDISGSLTGTGTDGVIPDSNPTVYTIKPNENSPDVSSTPVKINVDEYKRYADSKSTFNSKALNGTKNLYGLHFMDSTISKDATVQAENVKINKQTYSGNDTFEMPVNSIDFTLKDKGIVNFFAGTYFSNNNSFFSLHKIFRYKADDTIPQGKKVNDIKAIREIYAIYADNEDSHSVIYQLRDGNGFIYTAPYRLTSGTERYVLPSDGTTSTTAYSPESTITAEQLANYKSRLGYSLKYLYSQIGINNSLSNSTYGSKLFYFEIPMNDGEFCLGSVPDGTGAYLLYLDIAANAAKINRTIFSERYTIKKELFEYPLGVAYVDSAANVDPLDSITLSVGTGYTGILTVSRIEDDVTVTRNESTKASAIPKYSADSISLNIANELVPKNRTIEEVQTIQYVDYNVSMKEQIITIIKDVTTKTLANPSGTTQRYVNQYHANEDGTGIGEEITGDEVKIFNTATGKRIDTSDVGDRTEYLLTATDAKPGLGYIDPGTETTLLNIVYLEPQGTSSDETWAITFSVDSTKESSGVYYKFDGFELEITVTGSKILVKVLSLGNKTIKIGNRELTNADVGNTIEIDIAN